MLVFPGTNTMQMRLTGFKFSLLGPAIIVRQKYQVILMPPWHNLDLDLLARCGTFRIHISNVCWVDGDIHIDEIASCEVFEFGGVLIHCETVAR